MDNPSPGRRIDGITHVSRVVAAYISNNAVRGADLPDLIGSIHAALKALASSPSAEAAVARPSSAEIRRSCTPEALISFIDGKPYKTLKRHLTKHGLDPARYRARYGLPADYPMNAASHSAARSELARRRGLGRKAEAGPEAPPMEPRRPGRPRASRAT